MFGGAFNVGININADKIIYNDLVPPLADLMKAFRDNSKEDILKYIDTTIAKFKLSKTNKEAYYNFREYYNKNNSCDDGKKNNPLDLFILSCFSFSNYISFSYNYKKFNSSAGTNRSHYTKDMKNNLILFKDKMDKIDLTILNNSFEELDYDADAFYYLDPPYFLTDATYNKFWNESKEKELLKILSQANFKFALSNVIEYNGKTNNLLKEAVKENNWNVIPIESDYRTNSSNQKKRIKNNEVLVINYEKPTIQKGLDEWR